MPLSIVALLIDFGLVVLIWIIQTIIYPSFLYYTTQNLVIWHRKYTPLIAYIVGPLMVLQLGILVYRFAMESTLFNSIGLATLSVIWISTFLQFVPMHNNISKGRVSDKLLRSLVKKNWLRTFLFTALFILNAVVFAQT